MSIKDIAQGRSDLYRVSPYDLHVREDWNERDMDDPANIEHVDQLARSMAARDENGEIQGQKVPSVGYYEDGKIWIEGGHCRRLAAIKAIEEYGAPKDMTIPIIMSPKSATEADRVLSQIIHNNGKEFSPIEQGRVFMRLNKLGMSNEQIAEKCGLSRVHVANLIELCQSPKPLRKLVSENKVSATLAIATLKKTKGDGKKAVEKLKAAVKEAKLLGKDRATEKHLRAAEEKRAKKADTATGERKSENDTRVGAEAVEAFISAMERMTIVEEDEGKVTITMSRADFDLFREERSRRTRRNRDTDDVV